MSSSAVGRRSVPLAPECLEGFDAALIVTDHDAVDYAALLESLPLVVDTRNVTRRLGAHAARVVRA